jgi:hypothetical protein
MRMPFHGRKSLPFLTHFVSTAFLPTSRGRIVVHDLGSPSEPISKSTAAHSQDLR